jgi:hypothetical protein
LSVAEKIRQGNREKKKMGNGTRAREKEAVFPMMTYDDPNHNPPYSL